MPDVSPEVLEKCQQLLIKKSKTWTASVTMGVGCNLKGEVLYGEGYNQCHAWVSTAFRRFRQSKENFLVLSCHSKVRSKGICSAEAHEGIILWMASDDCPFSKYILNRGDKDSLLNGGVVIYCGEDGASENQALWICKVLRYGVEGSNALDVWHYLHKGGVNALLAIYIATYIRTVRGATFGFSGAEGHSAVFSGGYWGSYTAGANAKDCVIGKPYDKPSNTTEVFWSGKDHGKTEIDFIKTLTEPVKKSDGWGGTVAGNAADQDVILKRVLEWQRKIEAEIAAEGGIGDRVKQLLKPGKKTVFLEMDL